MKLRIGIMGTRGIPNRYGGFEQFAQILATGLLRRGHEVTVYNSSHHPYQEPVYEGVQIVHCRDWENRLGTAGQFLYDLHCIRHATRQSYDVLLHLGYTSDAVWWRRWPKHMQHIMNMDGMEWQRNKYNRFTKWFLRKAEGWGARHADVLVADSPVIGSYLWNTHKKEATCIAYPALPFSTPDTKALTGYPVLPHQYSLLIARMEPENNIEMIIRGYQTSGIKEPLVVVGNMKNRFGRSIRSAWNYPGIIYTGAVYDQSVLNNLRFFSRYYFHGHSVGGTNPSLLEAMACNAAILAHDNPYNRAVLGPDADYFSDADTIVKLIRTATGPDLLQQRKKQNREKIETLYSPEKIISSYERLMLDCVENSGRR